MSNYPIGIVVSRRISKLFESNSVLESTAVFMSGRNVIGEVTESIQKFIMDGWVHYNGDEAPPRIEEDLKYESMDRNEKVIFVYMYRLANNPNLQNQKRHKNPCRAITIFVMSCHELRPRHH